MPIPTRKEIDAKKQEINTLYGKLSEVESGLKEEKKINDRLRSDLATKTHQLMAVEQSIVEEQTSYRWQKTSITTKIDTIRLEGNEQIKKLDNMEAGLTIEMAEHDFLEEENERLHARLKRLATEHFQASMAQKQEREERKQKSFDTRATMEQILRRTLKEVDLEYMLKANDKMDSEAKWARLENIKLKKEAGKRQENCATLVRQQQESYDELVQVKVQTGVLHETSQKQEESSKLARVVLEEIKEKNAAMEERVDFMRLEIQALSSQLEHKQQLQAELSSLQNVLAKAEAERKQVCKSIIKSCRNSVKRALAISAKESKRKGAKLTKGFQAMGGEASPAPLPVAVIETKEKDKDDDDHSIASHMTGGSSVSAASSTVFLNNEDTVLKLQAEEEEVERKAIDDAEAVWNSRKSDVHIASRLRMEIRKTRKRELRDQLQQEAAAGFTRQQQQGKSASTVSIPVHMTQESVASEKSSLPKDSSVASGRSRSSQ